MKSPNLNQKDTAQRKCKECGIYNCATCHKTDAKGYLIQEPEYMPSTEMPCDWEGTELSYPKHNKRYHNTKSKHKTGWQKKHETVTSNNNANTNIPPEIPTNNAHINISPKLKNHSNNKRKFNANDTNNPAAKRRKINLISTSRLLLYLFDNTCSNQNNHLMTLYYILIIQQT